MKKGLVYLRRTMNGILQLHIEFVAPYRYYLLSKLHKLT